MTSGGVGFDKLNPRPSKRLRVSGSSERAEDAVALVWRYTQLVVS
jgi:hypothetical protein